MGFSCEHFPKVCQSCAAQKSLIPTLPANTEATILKEGWRSCAWQLARQCPGSVFSRALAACLDPEAGRRVLAKDLAGPDIAPQRRNGLVARLAHDDELPHAVHRGLGDAACPERVPAELLDLQSRPAGCTLEELADRVSVQTAPRNMTVSSNGPEDRAFSNPGPVEPLAQRADRASIADWHRRAGPLPFRRPPGLSSTCGR